MPLLLPLLALIPLAAQTEVQMFDGTSLNGWHGDERFWSVEDGQIVGRCTPENPCEKSTYLFWEGQASNFELSFEYKLIGGNSGVQYRSQELPNGDVAGYQADMEAGPNHSGILYESNGRGIMATRGTRFELLANGSKVDLPALGTAAELQESVLSEQWNHYRVIADGPQLIHEINGQRMIEVVDRSNLARSRGTFALQMHQGPPMEVRYRNFEFRPLGSVELERDPEWIWGIEAPVDNEVRFFAHSFELKEAAVVEDGMFTADNSFVLWLNGEEIAKGNNWAVPTQLRRGMVLEPGWHQLALKAENEGGPAGMLGYLNLTTRSGDRITVATAADWLTQRSEPKDWPAIAKPSIDEGWATCRSFGPVTASSGPWGNVFKKAEAPDPRTFDLAPGLICERVYSAQPGEGSWASMTFGADGTLYVSPERGRILRFDTNGTLPKPIGIDIGSAQGMEWANDSLYVNVAGAADSGGGLHRLRDTDGDGILDLRELVARYGVASEHGAHGIRQGPDGMLYLIHGNYTEPPLGASFDPLTSEQSAYQNWAEDVMLPRIWDPRGHAHGIMAPGAVLWRTDGKGGEWERIAGGMRNPYDIAISAAGEVFSYDADMEWDLGTPWYRPPRVLHLTPGAEFGWRSGSAKWPEHYPDSMPALINTDLSSPTGIELLEGSRFPADYQHSLLLGDWAWGRILCLDLEADGASYTGELKPFLEGRGVTVTDLEVGPDGWLWFITGGRGTQSGVFRVRHSQTSPTTNDVATDLPQPPLLELRRSLEDWQPSADLTASKLPANLLTSLNHADFHIQSAARNALERAFLTAPSLKWKSVKPQVRWSNASVLHAAMAWLKARPEEAAPRLAALFGEKFSWLELRGQNTQTQRLVLRVLMLMQTRGAGAVEALEDAAQAEQLAQDLQDNWLTIRKGLNQQFPLNDATANRMLAELLVKLEAPDLPRRYLEQLQLHADQQNQLYYAYLLRLVDRGWTHELRLRYFYWLHDAAQFQGGASLQGFLTAISNDAQQRIPSADWAAVEPELNRHKKQQLEAKAASVATVEARAFHRDWTLDEAVAAVETQYNQASATRGADVFRQALCLQCHRFDQQGGFLGPDLSAVSRRFLTRDVLQAVIDPEANKSDQYANISMPPGLLNTWKAQDLADMIKFLEGGRWP
jgi:hypothetical protein